MPLQQMIAGGLFQHTYWTMEVLSTNAERLAFLSQHYPMETQQVLREALNQLDRASRAAERLSASVGPIRITGIPETQSSPSGPGFRYGVTVDFTAGPSGRGGVTPGEFTGRIVYVTSPVQLTADQAEQAAVAQLQSRIQDVARSEGDNLDIEPNTFVTRIFSVTRS